MDRKLYDKMYKEVEAELTRIGEPSQIQINTAWYDATQRFQDDVRARLIKLMKPKLSNDFCDLAIANMPYVYQPEPGKPTGWDNTPVSEKAEAVLHFLRESDLIGIKRVFLPFVHRAICEIVQVKPSDDLYFDEIPFHLKQLMQIPTKKFAMTETL